MSSVRKLMVFAFLLGLSVVGALISIPSPIASIAFDAMPAFLGAMLMGGPIGALIAIAGHMFSALFHGFPLSFIFHVVVALIMGFVCLIVGFFAQPQRGPGVFIAAAAAFVLNGFAAPLILGFWPGFGWGMYVSSMLVMAGTSAINAALAVLLYYMFRRKYEAFVGG